MQPFIDMISQAREEKEITHWPLPEAQRMELATVIQSYDDLRQQPFKRGDFVRSKHALGILRHEEKLVLVYWRDLNPENWFDRRLIEADFGAGIPSCPDCLVAYQRDARTHFLALDSCTLEWYDP
jgi:hypothetical protein